MLSRTARSGEDKAHFLRKTITEQRAEALKKKHYKVLMNNCFSGLDFCDFYETLHDLPKDTNPTIIYSTKETNT